jgi:DNA-binding LacI/PurR family transcriptional regulator
MTIREVAKRAGVSLQTVSNVINGRTTQMADETRERVQRWIEELGYQPNLHARGLRSQRTYTLGFLTVDPSARFLSDPFHTAILSGMADILRDRDYGLLVQALHPNEPAEMFRRLFRQRRFDGAVVHLSGLGSARQRCIDALVKSSHPFVLIEEPVRGLACASVRANNREGAEGAIEHLVSRGHKRIGFLAAALDWPAVEERQAGYLAALKRHGLPARTIEVDTEDFETSRSTLEAALRKMPGLSAVVCSNDVVAVGALQAAKIMGRKVPDDFAIVGFDDFDFSRYVDPPLTTVALPAYDMGRQAAELLLDFQQEEAFPQQDEIFPTTLIQRGTT